MFSHVLDDDISTCVGCGLCLPHCPTFRVSGEEALSPRGRIATIKMVRSGDIEISDRVIDFLDTCVQCRACEPACPSGVPYGRMIEAAKQDLPKRRLPIWLRTFLRVLPVHRLLLLGRPLVVLFQRFLPVPHMSWRRSRIRGVVAPDVWVHIGCVMDIVQSDTHAGLAAIVEATGRTVGIPSSLGGCCGALQSHAGLHDVAVRLAERTMRSMPGEATILVDSAGCGAAMKEYGALLDTDEARAFSARVRDAVEWIADHSDEIPLDESRPRPTIVIQDPCHHRHVQRVHAATRTILSRVADLIEIPDDGLCCGAGGAYSLLQRDMAEKIRERKVAAIRQATDGSDVVVASANPGCSMFLGRAGLRTRHPVDVIAEALTRRDP